MRKMVLMFFVTIVFVCFSAVNVLAAENSSAGNSIFYNGKIYDVSGLSQSTIDWLKWYNGLSEESREMVSYVPEELIKINETGTYDMDSYPQVIETNVDLINNITPLSLAPTSGYEPVYNPSYWNAPSRIQRANCYIYAMDVISSKAGLKYLQPGYYSKKTWEKTI